MEPTLLEILDAREKRAEKQKALLAKYQKPLLCFTMNIPGPVKLDRDVSIGFFVGCRLLQDSLRGCRLLHRELHRSITGCEAYYVVDMPAEELKKIVMDIEDTPMIGRLFDMDVLDEKGNKLSRESLGGGRRKCLICDNDAYICAGRRSHPLEELTDRTGFLLYVAARQYLCEFIAVQAYLSLQQEVNVTPKPGLVDRRNNGAHKDMDIRHFFASATALRPFFCKAAETGYLNRDEAPSVCFQKLRPLGIEAEEAMRKATRGVNTHKGAIFSLGLLCAATGRLSPEQWTVEAILQECAAMVQGLTAADFAGITEETAQTVGQKLYLRYGITGIRGQAEQGFPSVKETGLPILRRGLSQGLTLNDAGCCTLLHLICSTDDTNLIHRGGRETQLEICQRLRSLLAETPFPDLAVIEELDKAFIQKNLSPGGSADLLALTFYLHFLCP